MARTRLRGRCPGFLSTCEAAFPTGMIPLLTSADILRRATVHVSITLPENERLQRLFLNAIWAHFLEPARFRESDTVPDGHLAAQRFGAPEQQQHLVKPLLLDWTGVLLVSSSFADELVGKLFASLGPLAFSARVRKVGMDATVRGLVDKAIMQRAAQVVNGTAADRDVR